MKLVWDIEYDYDEAYVIGIREGIARWWRSRRERRTFMTVVNGARDVSPLITMLDPDTSAFRTMLMSLPQSRLAGAHTVVEWLEDELLPRVANTLLWGDWAWVG